MKMVKASIKLTPEQAEKLQPLYDVLRAMAPTGLGITIGQLGGEDSFTEFNFGFSTAGFAVLDHTAAIRITELIKREVRRMALEGSTAAMIADAAKAQIEAEKANFEVIAESGS